MAILYCTYCGSGRAITGDVPTRCAECHRPTSWSTSPPIKDASGLKLGAKDTSLLHIFGIKAD